MLWRLQKTTNLNSLNYQSNEVNTTKPILTWINFDNINEENPHASDYEKIVFNPYEEQPWLETWLDLLWVTTVLKGKAIKKIFKKEKKEKKESWRKKYKISDNWSKLTLTPIKKWFFWRKEYNEYSTYLGYSNIEWGYNIDSVFNSNHRSKKINFSWVWKAMVEYMKTKKWVNVLTATIVTKKNIFIGFREMNFIEANKYQWTHIREKK